MAAMSTGHIPSSEALVLYGKEGPNKYDFIHHGILDDEYEGTRHRFVIDDREFRIKISGGRKIPAWQCPKHPEINESYHGLEWADAWEFWGCGSDDSGGYHVHGIYSLKTRKGVYHLWTIYCGGGEGCPTARQDLYAFFGNRNNDNSLLALERAMRHMVRGPGIGGEHHIDCKDCWELFRQLRRSCELP